MSSRRRHGARAPRLYCPIAFLTCSDLTREGRGIATLNGREYIVEELLPGEEARVQVFYEVEGKLIARAISLRKTSPVRALPLGHPKMQLGSYHIAHMTDAAQDDWKTALVQKTFNLPSSVPIIVGNRTNYRNKIVLHNGRFFAAGLRRRLALDPSKMAFDLMDVDFAKYANTKGELIIRHLDEEIAGEPGTKVWTTDTNGDLTFLVSLDSFYQTNSEMAAKVYTAISTYVNPKSTVFDLFSGVGTIGINLAAKAGKVYLIELSQESHQDAIFNIKLNNLTNVIAVKGDANQFSTLIIDKPDVIIVDPPRSGLQPESLVAINQSNVPRIIYLSCNILTQARDINAFTNYKIVHLQPYDFFPQTYHIENLIVLDLKNKKQA